VNKNEVARSELVGTDRVCVFLFKLINGGQVGFDDAVPDGVKVFWSLLELSCSEHYEFSSGHCRLWRNHVSSFGKVKREKGLDSMRYVICGMPEGLMSSDPFRPEDGMRCCRPLPFLSVTYFHNRSRWRRSTIPFTCELYGEMQM
jgi:hypothetical protein